MDFEEFKRSYQKVPVEHYPNNASDNPMVSVCVQTYQHADYIKDCLEGILMQKTDFPYEILLGEDDSTDGTREICIEYAEKYPDKIRLFLHNRENNIKIGGQSTGRFNFLYNLYNASGRYIALCEGDDYWIDPLKLQKQVEFMEENDSAGIIHTAYKIKDSINNKTYNYIQYIKNPVKNYILTGDMRTLTVLFRSKFLNEVMSVFKNRVIEKSPYGDRPAFLTIAAKSGVSYMPEVTGVYRKFHGPSVTKNKSIVGKYKKKINLLKVNKELLEVLSVRNKKYEYNLNWKIIKNKIIVQIVKIKIFNKIYHIIYHKLGMGTNKDERYY